MDHPPSALESAGETGEHTTGNDEAHLGQHGGGSADVAGATGEERRQAQRLLDEAIEATTKYRIRAGSARACRPESSSTLPTPSISRMTGSSTRRPRRLSSTARPKTAGWCWSGCCSSDPEATAGRTLAGQSLTGTITPPASMGWAKRQGHGEDLPRGLPDEEKPVRDDAPLVYQQPRDCFRRAGNAGGDPRVSAEHLARYPSRQKAADSP